jgi:hypothetical protein
MTKYVNMAPPRYEVDDSRSGVLLPFMVAAAAAVAVFTGLGTDTAKVTGMQFAGNAISWIEGFLTTVQACGPASGLHF